METHMNLVSTKLWNSGILLESVEKIDENTVLQLTDRYEDQELEFIVSNKGMPGFIVATWFSYFLTRSGIPINCVPIYFEYLAKFWKNYPLIIEPVTEKSFNFVINKKQINRFLAIKFIQYFKLVDNSYHTYSGMGRRHDMSPIMTDLHRYPWVGQRLKSHLLCPIDLPTAWISPAKDTENIPRTTQNQILHEESQDFARPDYGYNSDGCGGLIGAYLGGIKDIMDKTAVSLVCESNVYELSTTWTEKSLWPVLSLTMPIWIGGYRQADEFQRMGFDTFDDIINHRYQYSKSMLERCYLAIADNLPILQDIEYAQEIRQKMMPRLLTNRQLILSDHLEKFNTEIIKSWPKSVQHAIMPSFLKEFRGDPGYFCQKSNTP